MDETNTISFKNGKSSRSESSNRKEGVATVRTTQLPLLDRIVINDWKPPKPPSVPSCFDEETQLKALRQHVKSMRRDLRRHNELKEPMSASYQPHSSDAKAAQSNWEKKSRYLLTEIVKYDYYINYLQTAKSLRVKK
ncbi:hypothetical protein PQX77_001608 [Marasmius sp. AFHP31]|nr:hypothetical protein PQX77_001608 [Marasmius sp. AFHP31]